MAHTHNKIILCRVIVKLKINCTVSHYPITMPADIPIMYVLYVSDGKCVNCKVPYMILYLN